MFLYRTSFSVHCSKLKTFMRLKTFLKKTYPHLTQKCHYSSRLFVPVAKSITLEFKRLTYETLTSAVSQGAGTKPRIARFVVQMPRKRRRPVARWSVDRRDTKSEGPIETVAVPWVGFEWQNLNALVLF